MCSSAPPYKKKKSTTVREQSAKNWPEPEKKTHDNTCDMHFKNVYPFFEMKTTKLTKNPKVASQLWPSAPLKKNKKNTYPGWFATS